MSKGLRALNVAVDKILSYSPVRKDKRPKKQRVALAPKGKRPI